MYRSCRSLVATAVVLFVCPASAWALSTIIDPIGTNQISATACDVPFAGEIDTIVGLGTGTVEAQKGADTAVSNCSP